jgi:hypothetical protein
MNASNLRAAAFERFVSLLMNRAKDGDRRTAEQLRQAAAREVVREQHIANKSSNISHGNNAHAGDPFTTLFNKLWKICQNMAAHADMRRVPARAETVTPTIDTNPIIADEPVGPSPRRSKDDVVVTFPSITGNGSAKLIPDSEYSARFRDQTTSNWRNSILQNQEIAKQRAIASARHRSQHKYVG